MKEPLLPFYFLDKTVNVLIVDNDAATVKLLTQALETARLFRLATASTTRKALEILEEAPRYHVCISDLGISDVKDDEFFLLRKYNRHFPFVILTNSTSAEKGFAACALGARALVAKSPKFDYAAFIRLINRHALLNIVNPRYSGSGSDPLTTSTTVLFEKSPEFVTGWALEMGVTDRELRHIWRKKLGANAKIILFIYQMFCKAFAYYEEQIAQQFGSQAQLQHEQWAMSDAYRHIEEYFHLHRSTILDYLAFGNVVNFM